MGRSWGGFRIDQGEVQVAPEALHIRRTPLRFLRGQSARLRRGSIRDRAGGGLKLLGFLGSIAYLFLHLQQVLGGLDTAERYFVVLPLIAGLLSLALHYLTNTIPRGTLADLSVDPSTDTLTITHESGGPLSGRIRHAMSGWLGDGRLAEAVAPPRRERTVRFRTDDDRERALTVFRSTGLGAPDELLRPPPSQRETVFRHETRDGATFCPDCHRQVSPSDAACPACEATLQVRSPVEVESEA